MATAEPYVLFELAGTAYAIPSAAVQRMEMVEQVTPVPNAPAFVDGVVFSRGQVVPAMSLRGRFGFPRRGYDAATRLIVVAHGDRTVGLIVDSAREFVTIPADAVRPPPEGMAGTSGNYLGGIATVGGRVVLILSVAEVLGHASAH
ncbi:chemotaxis protein CheW [Gemmata sp. JC673]|uniref:Chemotaxis protein CheW n=1 Tax=Gemmata algarum TaxID=2975278 RepID=A0ABU5EXW9_9BACT|nr:chemotaxis protein CheW [Gemmata algarum]MDY3559970.1 chemotaxis protein CheW [Gemmata algarum]